MSSLDYETGDYTVTYDSVRGECVTTVTSTGEEVSARPFTDDEVILLTEEAQVEYEEEQASSLRAEIRDNVLTVQASLNALSAILNLTNADINSNPARHIKDVTRETLTVARQLVRIARAIAKD